MKIMPFKIIAAILAGPIFASILSLFKLVLAPPNQGISEILYLPICFLGFPVCIVLAIQKKLLGWKFLGGLALSFLAPYILLIVIYPIWMPSGLSNCQQVGSSLSMSKYECNDSSSDDGDYHHKFIIEGYKDWPIMQVIDK